jgi:hypothetical protein
MAEKWGGERWGWLPRRVGASNRGGSAPRPRAHQSDHRCRTGFDNADPASESLPALNYVPVPTSLPVAEKWMAEKWGGERSSRWSRRVGASNRGGSAPVPGRINATPDVGPVSITPIRRANIHSELRACPHSGSWQKNGGQKNGVVKDGGGCPGALEQAIAPGARPSPGGQNLNRKKNKNGVIAFFRFLFLFSANPKSRQMISW